MKFFRSLRDLRGFAVHFFYSSALMKIDYREGAKDAKKIFGEIQRAEAPRLRTWRTT